MLTALPAQHADTLEEAMVKPLRRILTRAVNKPLPGLPEGTQDASPGSPSPPISGCSDLSAPDRFSLRQQTAEAHTPSSKRASVPTPLRMSHTESSAEPVPPAQTGTNRARSISPADLDAAAAMLELPSAYQGSSSGGARGSNGGSSHNSDGGSAQAATAAAGSGAHQAALPEGPYAPELHASIADASAESAAELLLAAGRLASVSSQHSHSEKPHTGSSITRAPPSYGMLPAGAAAEATAARTTDHPGREYTPAAVTAAFIHPGAFDTAGGFPGAAQPFAPGFYYGHSTTGASHHAGMYSISMANRPVGCSCLKPCKPHTPCQQCGSPHSPGHTWRAGPTGPGTLCNACGTRYSRSKQKQMAAAAAASFAAGGHGEMMFWSGSSGGSSAYTDSLACSSGVGKSMKAGSGKQGRAGKVASSRVVKGSGGSRSSKGGAGTPYGVLAALERRWGAQSSNAQGPSVSGSQSGGGEGKGLEEQASVSEEQQAWMLQWQQYEQHYSQYKGQGEGEAGRAAGQQPDQQQQGQQQQQHWLAYSNWLPQQDERQQQ